LNQNYCKDDFLETEMYKRCGILCRIIISKTLLG